MAIEYYQRTTADLVRDDAARITPEQIDAAICAAVARYSGEVPRSLTADLATVAGQLQSAPDDWVHGESRIASAEYPVGQVPPAHLPDGSIYVLPQPDGTDKLGLVDALAVGSTLRLAFTAPHVVDSQRDTVPAKRRLGVAFLAAARLCGQLASFYANQTDSTIAADAVEHKSKSELWAARERNYLKQAEGELGISLTAAASAPGQEAAGVVVSFAPRRGTRAERGLRIV